jgi:hypothetical protein
MASTQDLIKTAVERFEPSPALASLKLVFGLELRKGGRADVRVGFPVEDLRRPRRRTHG